jgi:glycosyltransferase involved in cell wall biosynthesis
MITSVLIPAHDEADWLPACLDALVASDDVQWGVEVIVIANGCMDNTVAVAQRYEEPLVAKGWSLIVLDLEEGGKLGALNAGEAASTGQALIYLDADVQVSPPLINQIAEALEGAEPRYASGRPNVTVKGNWLIRAYTRFWRTTPFMTNGVPGFGVFAMNRAGRARWGEWPDIISDDTFARWNFTPQERHSVPASYDWPMIDTFGQLVQVRRRQDVGVAEVETMFPDLVANDDVHDDTTPIWKRALRDPIAFVVFCALRLAIRLPFWRSDNRWARGR